VADDDKPRARGRVSKIVLAVILAAMFGITVFERIVGSSGGIGN
jgi:hypothetical protein